MEDFVTYEQAEKLADLGFDYKCIACYNEEEFDYTGEYSNYNLGYYHDNLISAPNIYQAQKWLREKHDIIVLVDTYFKNYMNEDFSKAEFEYVIVDMNNNALRKASHENKELFEFYENALSAGISKAIEYIEEND